MLLGVARACTACLGRMDWTAKLTAQDLFPGEDQADLRGLAAERLARIHRGEFLRAVLALAQMRLWGRLPSIDRPVLVLASEGDRTVPFRQQRAMAGRVPGARFVALSHAGHASPIDSPDRVNGLIREFLAEVDSRGHRPFPAAGRPADGKSERAAVGRG